LQIWEPVFRHLIEITERPNSPIRIDEIWSMDCIAHGDAALINGRYLPKLRKSFPFNHVNHSPQRSTADRRDYGRDIANLLINFLPETAGQDVPQLLERLPGAVASRRAENGLANRLVLGLGHSLGADATVRCALEWPAIFSAIVVAESTLFPASQNGSRAGPIVIKSTLGRRSAWPSREEAKKGLLKSPMFAAWDPAAVDAYVRYGMYEDPTTGQIHLKCPPGMEACEFTRRQTMNEAFELMPTIDDRLEIRWIMGAKEGASAL
jgi:pimeloyl-ACP methyl ester carboxylesterase